MRSLAVASLLSAFLTGAVSAAEPEKVTGSPYKATTSRAAREDAQRSIPLDKLAPDARVKVSTVLAGSPIFRRMPLQVIDCEPNFYLFMVRHPDVMVNIWEVLSLSKIELRQTGPGAFRAADGAGTLGKVQYLYSGYDTQVIYAEGSYEGPLFTHPVQGKCLLVLKAGYIREPNGRYYITNRLDAFMHVESKGVEILAKTFQPLVGKVADYNFVETAGFLGRLSHTAEVNRDGMARLASKLENVHPEIRDQFALVVDQVAEKADVRQAAAEAPMPIGPSSLRPTTTLKPTTPPTLKR
ncbi:MAG: hypothetical protein ACYC35_04845 [Pirellulales bacterium]